MSDPEQMSDSDRMETMAAATARLREDGYVEDWNAVDGRLQCSACGAAHAVDEVTVDEIVRFEGTTDPADEGILYALTGACGHRGLYATAYGPAASAEDAEVVGALSRAARHGT